MWVLCGRKFCTAQFEQNTAHYQGISNILSKWYLKEENKVEIEFYCSSRCKVLI
jgi:hypothetical protein